MTQSEHETLMRRHDFLAAFKLFKETGMKLTDEDIAFMQRALDVTARHDEQEEV